MPDELIVIPRHFFNATYDGSKYPGSGVCNGIEEGANCQYFAYEVLRYFGYVVPDLRSSELWNDTEYSEQVASFEPLDILFFNKNSDAYGAHLGVYVGAHKVVHLSQEVGLPVVWDLAEFSKRQQYVCLLGGKRFRGGTTSG